MIIDKSSHIPVYYQVKEEVRSKISKGIWKVGECIDSERELSETYGISRMTIRQALGELVQEGILIREKGRGTFVCEPKVKQRDVMSFSEIARRNGINIKTEVLEFKKINTPKAISNSLPFDEIYRVDRLRIIDGDVIANEIVYIPCDYCGYIDAKLLEGSLYKLIDGYGYSISYSKSDIQAIIMNDKYKKIFRTEEILPLLKVRSNNMTQDGKLLFIEEAVYRSDKYILEVNILMREGKLR